MDLLGLSAAQSVQLETVRQTIDAVRVAERGAEVKILLGGLVFTRSPDLAAKMGADGFARSPSEAIAVGRELVGH